MAVPSSNIDIEVPPPPIQDVRWNEATKRQTRVATVFTVFSVVSLLATWFLSPSHTNQLWRFLVCSGAVLLVGSRYSTRHPVPLPKIWLLSFFVLSFPLLSDFYFEKLSSASKVNSVDELLWAVDASFGYPQPHLTRFLMSWPLLFILCKGVWLSLPLFFVGAYLALPDIVQTKYLAAIVCIGCVIAPLYALCPGAGPKYLFGTYPESLPILAHPHPVSLHAGIQLNTTPSGHFAWALMMFWFTYKYSRKWVAVVFSLIVVLTIAATLGLGEHYIIDLILSVPYATGIWWLVWKQWQRASVFLLIVTAWLISLRIGWALLMPPPMVWVLCALTISCCTMWKPQTEFSR